ncbi:M14 family metallopeptidase [uncultured Succinivibrio sp.]|uniref:M14 family metallopeptidase n=1 Tax=uncultured Succinivibrio sp. TaxID=540749 RepID=UPI0025DFB532|nr:M14 family metallopeptidase [uncultured Succinivibrio sp.]
MIQEVFSAELPVGEKLLIKKNVIKNGNSGKRICIVTGTHGDELEGQYVAFLLNSILSRSDALAHLDGTVEIYPALNPLGIDSITRGIPNFDIDMNRIFPGSLSGSLPEAAAHYIVEELCGADLVIDIHSSNIFLNEIPQVRICVNQQAELVPLANLLNIDFVWVHDAATVLESTLAHSLNIIGTRTLVVEMGVGMRITNEYGEALIDGIFNLMRHLGMWSGPVIEKVKAPILSVKDEVEFVNASVSGVFLTRKSNNCKVKKGESIGRIVSSLSGEVLEDVKAPADGLMFTLRAYPVVYEGSLLARIHRISRD